jgi:hypothetical protein
MCPTALTRQALRTGLLMTLIFILMSCGGGPDEGETQARKLPEDKEVKRFIAGEYVSDEFRPAMSFRLGAGWYNWPVEFDGAGPGESMELRNNLVLFYAPEGTFVGVIDFIVDPKVYKMVSSYEAKVEPTPEDIATWLQQNPYLDTKEPEAAIVGGEKGVQFDALPSPVPEDYLACGEPCLPLFQNTTDPELFFALERGYQTRFLVLDHVEGETVTIAITALADKFDEFLPKAQKVLDTVEWKGA